MPIQAVDAAKFICENGNWGVTNLKLQKLLYIADMLHIGRTQRRLIDATFEAWEFGPVLPEIYRKVKAFGDEPVRNVFVDAHEIPASTERTALEDTCERFLKMSPSQLVAITHWETGAWAKNYIPRARGVPISNSDILDEYRSRTTR
jgi:uncharacterized phage-associated protein